MISAEKYLINVGIYTAVACVFLVRPSHLGEEFNLPGTLLLFGASLLFIIFSRGYLSVVAVKRVISVPVLLITFWFFMIFHGLYNEISFRGLYFSSISAILISFSIFAISLNEDIQQKFTVVLVFIIGILGLSSVISVALSVLIPLENMIIGKIEVSTYRSGDLFFPFSLAYDKSGMDYTSNIRFGAFWREVGIAQAIFSWATAVLLFSPTIRYRKTQLFGTIGGCILTQSTLASINLSIVFLAYAILSNSRNIWKKAFAICFATLFSGLLFISFFTTETIGVFDKILTTSFLDRWTSLSYGIYEFKKNPFGYGFYGNSEYLISNTSINLIASLAGLGIFGVILYINIWIYSVFFDKNPRKKLACIFPIFITALTSQPLIDSFGIYIILSLPAVLQSTKAS